MRITVTTAFNDLAARDAKTGEVPRRDIGDHLNVTEPRGNELIEIGVAVVGTEEVAVEKPAAKPKASRPRKPVVAKPAPVAALPASDPADPETTA